MTPGWWAEVWYSQPRMEPYVSLKRVVADFVDPQPYKGPLVTGTLVAAPPKPAEDTAPKAAALSRVLDSVQHAITCHLMDQRANRPEQVCTCGLWEATPVVERLLDELERLASMSAPREGEPGGTDGQGSVETPR